MGSQDTLVADLLRKPPDALRDKLIANAMAGLYHDYKSTEPVPKLLLISDLERYGYRDLARRAKRGAYDDRPDAEDSADMDDWLAKNPKMAAVWEAMAKTHDPEEAFSLVAELLTPEEREAMRAELGERFFAMKRREPG